MKKIRACGRLSYAIYLEMHLEVIYHFRRKETHGIKLKFSG